MKKRNISLDGLRVIGLLAIILAHVGPPAWLFQLRNFDVPLMVFVSGAVYGLSSGRTKNYFSYIGKRVQRLLFPTWIFLSFYFLFFLIVAKITHQPFPFTSGTVLTSYTLQSGIGYVWIIRVFVLVALISPLLIRFSTDFKKYYLLLLLVSYVFYECFYGVYSDLSLIKHNAVFNSIFQDYLFYLFPYGIVAGLGIFLQQSSKAARTWFLAIFIILFIGEQVLFHGANINTQIAKYPPTSYYLSYALAVTIALTFLSETKGFLSIFQTRFFQFIASSTLWIYLWHILFLTLWEKRIFYLPAAYHLYYVEYFYVIFWALCVTYLQKKVIKKYMSIVSLNSFFTSFLQESFLK
jgi:fucose 4-O-acetylase-like acetyltransferase